MTCQLNLGVTNDLLPTPSWAPAGQLASLGVELGQSEALGDYRPTDLTDGRTESVCVCVRDILACISQRRENWLRNRTLSQLEWEYKKK